MIWIVYSCIISGIILSFILFLKKQLQNTPSGEGIALSKNKIIGGSGITFLILILLSIFWYLHIGKPDYPSMGFSQRQFNILPAFEQEILENDLQQVLLILEEEPNNPDVYVALSEIFWRFGDTIQALFTIDTARKKGIESPALQLQYIRLRYHDDDDSIQDDLIPMIKNLSALSPQSLWLGFFTIVIEEQQGNLQNSYSQYQELLSMIKQESPLHPVLIKRITNLENILQIPTEDRLQTNANAFNSEEQVFIAQMVEGLATRLAENNYDDIEGVLQLGRSYIVLENFNDAKDIYKKGLEVHPNAVMILLAYVRLLRDHADLQSPEDDIIALTQKIITLEPDNIEALWMMGYDAAQNQDSQSATQYFDRALQQLEPTDPLYQTLEENKQDILSRIQ